MKGMINLQLKNIKSSLQLQAIKFLNERQLQIHWKCPVTTDNESFHWRFPLYPAQENLFHDSWGWKQKFISPAAKWMERKAQIWSAPRGAPFCITDSFLWTHSVHPAEQSQNNGINRENRAAVMDVPLQQYLLFSCDPRQDTEAVSGTVPASGSSSRSNADRHWTLQS